MSWIWIAILALGAYLLTAWRSAESKRGVSPEDLGGWLEWLMRAYEDGAHMLAVGESGQVQLRFILLTGAGGGCRLRLLVMPTAIATQHQDVLKLTANQEADQCAPGEAEAENDALASVLIDVTDRWATGSGARTARVVQKLLAAMALSVDTSFNLSFEGRKSLERSKEMRDRQRERVGRLRGP